MSYCIASDVVGEQGISGLAVGDIHATLLSKSIEDATAEVDRLTGNPVEISYELHIGDGNKDVFNLKTQNGITAIDAVIIDGLLSKQPLPINGYDWIEDTDNWDATDCTITADTTVYKARAESLKVVVESGDTGVAKYNSNANLRLITDAYPYFSFWVYASVATQTFTVTLYKDATNYIQKTFTVPLASGWIFVSLAIANFTKTGSIANSSRGINAEINYLEMSVAGEVTYYLSGMCFTDKYAPVLGIGQIAISDSDNLLGPNARILISYKVDIFDTVPNDVQLATASLAAATAWGYFAGKRYRKVGGVILLDGGIDKNQRFFNFEHIIKRHRKVGLEKLSEYIEGPELLWTEEEEFEYG